MWLQHRMERSPQARPLAQAEVATAPPSHGIPTVDGSSAITDGMFTSRGVAAWRDSNTTKGVCRARVLLGTLDARLIAIDADTGLACAGFGKHGEVDLSEGIRRYRKRDYSLTSPPAVVGDHSAANLEPGVVRAHDVRTGTLAWSWDPIPRNDDHPGAGSWTKSHGNRTGGANVWSVVAADPERDLIFLPTTSPSPDFYGGERLGDNAFANSVVALRASTGEFVWGYQTVHHDLWDYDLAAQPLLFDHTLADGTKRLRRQGTDAAPPVRFRRCSLCVCAPARRRNFHATRPLVATRRRRRRPCGGDLSRPEGARSPSPRKRRAGSRRWDALVASRVDQRPRYGNPTRATTRVAPRVPGMGMN